MTLPERTEFELMSHDGRLCWLHTPTGRVLPFVAGGADDGGEGGQGGDGGEGGQGGEGGDGGTGEGRTFTQAEVDRHAGRARSEGKRAAAQEMAQELGVTVDEAKKIIASHNEAEAKNKSEAERAADEARKAEAAAKADRDAAARERFDAKLERQLGKAGVPDTALTRAIRLVDLDPAASDDDIAAEIDKLREDVPGLFEERKEGEGEQKSPKSPSGATGKPPTGGQATKTALQKGEERWKATHPQKTTSAA